MPDLPTLSVTVPQAQRCLAAWGSVAAYKTWLAGQVRGYVQASERAAIYRDIQDQAAGRIAAVDVDPLDGAT